MISPRLDLSQLPDLLRDKLEAQMARLPDEARHRLQAQLSKLPPDQLARFVERGAPMLDRLLASADQARAAVSQQREVRVDLKPAGHFNRTVQAGDRPGLVSKILLGLALVLVLFYLL